MFFAGIDWGGTYIKFGLLNSRGKVIKKNVYISSRLKEKKDFINTLGKIIKSNNIKALGIGAPGLINVEEGFIYYLPNIPGWENFPLKKELEKRLQIPVFIDNDANLFSLAEARFGAAKGKSRAIFLTLGTGLGGGILYEGKIMHGATTAFELGHIPVDINGKKCSCGSRGCIETFVGNNYLVKEYKKLKNISREKLEVKDIFQKALKGEKEAKKIWKDFSYYLGAFLAGMVNLFNPEVIVLGGGVSGAISVFKAELEKEIKKRAMPPNLAGLKILKAKLKSAGIIGAALLAREKFKTR